MRFKKALAFAFVFAVIFLNAFSKDIKKASGSKLKVVATVFPEYDWAREIIGQKSDEAELSLLLENGVDLHSYSPSVADIAKIHESDIFIYVGGESDGWVRDVLKSSGNKETLLVNLLETLGDNAKEEELVEGMQKEADENAAGLELDEHVWLSLKNARVFCEAICAALCKKDSKNSSAYQKNSAAYVEKLSALDEQFARVSSETQKRVLLFGDRFPFRYLFDDYGLKYYAAFAGCSAESEASFKTVIFLSKKLGELNLSAVCQNENSDSKIAKTIIQNSRNKKAKIVVFDSMQSTTAEQIKGGATYFGLMQKNLEALKEAL